MAGRLGAFGAAADLVVSGINPGNNTGRAMLHSGTVGAALTAANFGVLGGRGEHRLVPTHRTGTTAGAFAVAAVELAR